MRCPPLLQSVNLPSTPPLPAPLLSAAPPYNSPIPSAVSSAQRHPSANSDPSLGPLGSTGDAELADNTWVFNAFSSPPSPSTIASTTDSQIGGETFPPSSESTEEESSGSNHSRQNLSLSFSSLPSVFPQFQQYQSPTSLPSSGAPFTDSFSAHNSDFGQDYFHFPPDEPLSAGAEDSIQSQSPLIGGQQQQQQQQPHRLPASQPSSPARSIFPQQHQTPLGGRQRGATFSGGSFYSFGAANPLNFTFAQPLAPQQALPTHISLSSVQASNGSPSSPLAPSPDITTASPQYQGAQSQFLAPNSAQQHKTGENDIVMDDMSTPTPVHPRIVSAPVRRSSLGQYSQQALPQNLIAAQSFPQVQLPQNPSAGLTSSDMSSEMIDKLSLLDKILDSAQSAREALLRGQEVEVSHNLSDISTQLEVASELGVGPAHPSRDSTTPNSQSSQQSTSPNGYHQSPPVQAAAPAPAPQYHMPMMATSVPPQLHDMPMTVQPSNLLSSLVADQNQQGRRAPPIQTANHAMPSGTKMVTGDYLGKVQAPPLVHSHSYPNGHQLPSQLSGNIPPSTPVAPSPNFITSISAQHMPMISSPLATVPPSRPPSPPRYALPNQWEVEMMPIDMGVQHQVPAPAQQSAHPLERRPSTAERPDGRPIARGRSMSVNRNWNQNNGHNAMTSSVPPSAWQSRAGSPVDDDDEDSDDEGLRKTKRRRSSVGVDAQADITGGISDEVRKQLDQIFAEFLNSICCDLEMTDSKGEKIHQVLMPKKMQKLDESTDYRPFKFRIQAFTNAFADNLQQRGITEEIMSIKKIKNYLWRQNLISRFNPDGKKAKSKGNHIWNVDAKKLPGGGWVFRPFQRRIIGQPSNFALAGQRYEWEPRIWDPQAASETLRPTFSSPTGSLPSWLRWESGAKLVGVPDKPGPPFEIPVHAQFVDGGGQDATIDAVYPCQVVPQMTPMESSSQPVPMFQPMFNPIPPQSGFEYMGHQMPPQMNMASAPSQPELQFNNNNMVYPQPNGYSAQQ
ncbi:hypothetical protein L198_03921 [Cryptococcus wingfieldii CBS 7118]|uniref:Uncharacterized protein n=1 Tax=Cryptococcus wingfieldii CBS 7118 TaxID=1295528 RepID=A0A1E3J909_9TREE|nr:hypothetical protein L198_03921 [Cryptococcus wingfieldii CBS 7118]ODN97358.1 hypothetical protein L198_03921 [Cryptococcus wingfieldii CBS 7118]